MQTIWRWILIFLTVMYIPSPSQLLLSSSDSGMQIPVNCSGIIEFLGFFANPEYYLSTDEYAVGDELEKIQNLTEDITENCDSTYEKINAVLVYVADNTYYDYQYLEGIEFRSQAPYDALTTGIAVCQGYSDLATVMLRSIGVPCLTATSRTHAYNFAHDGKRWVFFDPTWCSYNKYTVNGELLYEGYTEKYFDLTSEEISLLGEAHETSYIICDSAIAHFDWDKSVAVISSVSESIRLDPFG